MLKRALFKMGVLKLMIEHTDYEKIGVNQSDIITYDEIKEVLQDIIDEHSKTASTSESNCNITHVVGRSEQFICLCPRTKEDDCDRKEPCIECKTCHHFRQ